MKTLKTCKAGHRFYKSSDCPTCPQCEADKKPKNGFLGLLAAPAKRAMENEGIKTLKKLSSYSKKEILALHGMGPSSIPILEIALLGEGLNFKK